MLTINTSNVVAWPKVPEHGGIGRAPHLLVRLHAAQRPLWQAASQRLQLRPREAPRDGRQEGPEDSGPLRQPPGRRRGLNRGLGGGGGAGVGGAGERLFARAAAQRLQMQLVLGEAGDAREAV